jgi:hypothetical protein
MCDRTCCWVLAVAGLLIAADQGRAQFSPYSPYGQPRSSGFNPYNPHSDPFGTATRIPGLPPQVQRMLEPHDPFSGFHDPMQPRTRNQLGVPMGLNGRSFVPGQPYRRLDDENNQQPLGAGITPTYPTALHAAGNTNVRHIQAPLRVDFPHGSSTSGFGRTASRAGGWVAGGAVVAGGAGLCALFRRRSDKNKLGDRA